jgi:hypothetical protein
VATTLYCGRPTFSFLFFRWVFGNISWGRFSAIERGFVVFLIADQIFFLVLWGVYISKRWELAGRIILTVFVSAACFFPSYLLFGVDRPMFPRGFLENAVFSDEGKYVLVLVQALLVLLFFGFIIEKWFQPSRNRR